MKRLLPLLPLLLISACAQQSSKPVALIPVEERNVPTEVNQTANPSEQYNKAAPDEDSPVILALLKESDAHKETGNTNKAVATIERALRIEPNNSRLWYEFAALRFQQQQWQQAIALARKSIALASHTVDLKNKSWELIAECHDRLGNKDKARQARQQIRLPG